MPAETKRRWPRILALAVVSFAVGLSASRALTPRAAEDDRPSGPPAPSHLTLPSPDLSPERVVEEQMRALSRCRQDRSAVHQVYAYASSANRAVVGPVERLEEMILSPPYNAMVVNRGWRIGRAALRADAATVLVTVIGPNNEVGLYRFYLSREVDGSWMTDHVFCLTGGPPADHDPRPSSI